MKSILVLIVFIFSSLAHSASDATLIQDTIKKYQKSLELKDLKLMESTVSADMTIFEGATKNIGWLDYRNNHIKGEMDEWKSFRTLKSEVLKSEVSKATAFVLLASEYEIELPEKKLVLESLETFILRHKNGSWLISHIHSSGRLKK